MRIAIDINGTIQNVIECDDIETAQTLFPDATVFEAGTVGIGWAKVGEAYEAPPVPDPAPLSLTHLQFIEHAQAVGGITDAELVAAEQDANLAAFWIKFRLATSIDRDNPTIGVGLNALVTLNYLTAAERAAVAEQWPVA